MPAHKRYSSPEDLLNDEDSLQQHYRRKQSRRDRGAEEDGERERDDEEDVNEEDDPEGEDSDGSRSSDDPAKLSEWILVELPALRTYVQCPICLGRVPATEFLRMNCRVGRLKETTCKKLENRIDVLIRIIKKTRTVMECLHRFCRECIDKSMRLGNNECPACRTHCASRRSLRDDPRFDALIEILYDDIEKYEEEELAFHDEEKTRNKQIQASIAQIFRRQSEALVTRRKTGKDTTSPSSARLPHSYRKAYGRRRRNTGGTEHEGSEDEDENNHEGNKDSSSTDERDTEIKQRRRKSKAGAQLSQPSPSAANSDGGGIGNDFEASRESKGTSSGPLRNPEVLAWGGGGARSRSVRNTRIMKMTKYLENVKENDDKLDVHLMLISWDKQRTPSLQHLYLCCPPCFSVESLEEYVADKTQCRVEDVEILLVQKHPTTSDLQPTLDPSTLVHNEVVQQILEGQETLAGLRADFASTGNHLIVAYRLKERD